MEVCHYDVVVAGGGVSGVCAAIASARAGAGTALIQNRPTLGGNSSSEIRVWTRGAVGGGALYAEEMGILGELKLHNLHINPDYNPILWDEALLDKVLAEPNITLFLNTNITDVQMHSPERIHAVIANQLGTEEQFKICGKIFVDATGDGTVGYFADADFRQGRESSQEFGESLGVPKSDTCREGSTLMFQSKDEGKTIHFVKPDYAYDIPYIENLLNRGGRIVNQKMNGCDYWWLEHGGTQDTIRKNQEISLELKRLLMGIWNYIKNSGKFDAETLTLEWVGNVPGKRESRRFVGKYTLTQNDVEQNRDFADAVCGGGWFMDFHPSEGIYSEKEFCTQVPVFPYQIPMRCFFSDDLHNLVFSGRNISATHAAFTSTRIMNTCGQIGQVSGEIAAFCAMQECTVSQAYSSHLEKIQQNLLKNDMTIWGLKNRDPGDKARAAAVTASSVRAVENRESTQTMLLDKEVFLAVPRIGNSIVIEVECECSTELECTLYSCRVPSRKVDGTKLNSFTLKLSKGQPFVRIDLSKAPQDTYLKIVFAPNPSVRLKTSLQSMTGFLAGYRESPYYFTPCVTMADSHGYDAANVINGLNRPQNGIHLWCSGAQEKEQWLQLNWEKEQTFSQIRLTFNPDLSMELPSSISKISNDHHAFARREGQPKELIQAFSIHAWKDGAWVQIAQVTDNYQRLCVVNLPETTTSKVKIVFEKSGGSPYAEVFEVRVYKA